MTFTPPTFTDEELDALPLDVLVSAADRELRYRQNVYPRLINNGRMTAKLATDQIRAMAAIHRFLVQQKRKQELPLA